MAHATSSDLEHEHAPYYTPLPEDYTSSPLASSRQSRPLKGFAVIVTSVVFLLSLVGLVLNNQGLEPSVTPESNNNNAPKTMPAAASEIPKAVPRGVAQGVSAKSNPAFSDVAAPFNWTNAMFAWQRTAYHFQPEKNWMNDPDGPLFYMGWYHLFYQYNPDSAIWGNITWGHAVSKDLIHWLYLPLAMVPDQWYDINGVWTGSATLLPDGQIVMLYTGDTNASVQVQNLAYPANLSYPLLLEWVKYEWLAPDGTWRIAIGSTVNKTGISLVYKTTTNFTTFELLDNVLHAVPGTGEWECVDFYPVSTNGSKGLDTSSYGPGTKHVLKASLDDTCSSCWLDAMKSSSPPHKKIAKDFNSEHTSADITDVAYLTWMLKYPSALASFEKIANHAKGKRIALFLDYDGTLSPIVDNPDRAFMSNAMRAAVKNVAKYFPTAIISGRSRDKVYGFVGLTELYYAGSHGMDIVGPVRQSVSNDQPNCIRSTDMMGKEVNLFQPASEFLPMIDEIFRSLVKSTEDIKGAKVENNKFCVSVHYRNVDEKSWTTVAERVKNILKNYPRLRLTHGRKVLEVRPVIDWDKGKAVTFLLESLGLSNCDDVLPIYVGDDRTDEDAFKVLKEGNQGYGILVSSVPKESNAFYSLREPSEVMEFLKFLVKWKKSSESSAL